MVQIMMKRSQLSTPKPEIRTGVCLKNWRLNPAPYFVFHLSENTDVGETENCVFNLGGIVMDIGAKGSVLKHWYATLKTPNQVHTYWHTLEALANQDQES